MLRDLPFSRICNANVDEASGGGAAVITAPTQVYSDPLQAAMAMGYVPEEPSVSLPQPLPQPTAPSYSYTAPEPESVQPTPVAPSYIAVSSSVPTITAYDPIYGTPYEMATPEAAAADAVATPSVPTGAYDQSGSLISFSQYDPTQASTYVPPQSSQQQYSSSQNNIPEALQNAMAMGYVQEEAPYQRSMLSDQQKTDLYDSLYGYKTNESLATAIRTGKITGDQLRTAEEVGIYKPGTSAEILSLTGDLSIRESSTKAVAKFVNEDGTLRLADAINAGISAAEIRNAGYTLSQEKYDDVKTKIEAQNVHREAVVSGNDLSMRAYVPEKPATWYSWAQPGSEYALFGQKGLLGQPRSLNPTKGSGGYVGSGESYAKDLLEKAPIVGPGVTTAYHWSEQTPTQRAVGIGSTLISALPLIPKVQTTIGKIFELPTEPYGYPAPKQEIPVYRTTSGITTGGQTVKAPSLVKEVPVETAYTQMIERYPGPSSFSSFDVGIPGTQPRLVTMSGSGGYSGTYTGNIDYVRGGFNLGGAPTAIYGAAPEMPTTFRMPSMYTSFVDSGISFSMTGSQAATAGAVALVPAVVLSGGIGSIVQGSVQAGQSQDVLSVTPQTGVLRPLSVSENTLAAPSSIAYSQDSLNPMKPVESKLAGGTTNIQQATIYRDLTQITPSVTSTQPMVVDRPTDVATTPTEGSISKPKDVDDGTTINQPVTQDNPIIIEEPVVTDDNLKVNQPEDDINNPVTNIPNNPPPPRIGTPVGGIFPPLSGKGSGGGGGGGGGGSGSGSVKKSYKKGYFKIPRTVVYMPKVNTSYLVPKTLRDELQADSGVQRIGTEEANTVAGKRQVYTAAPSARLKSGATEDMTSTYRGRRTLQHDIGKVI